MPGVFVMEISEERLTYNNATNVPEVDSWKKANESELASIQKNGTWTIVSKPKSGNILTSRWVFRRKTVQSDNEEKTLKYEARLVIRRFQQQHGIDYHETFVPVVKFSMLRLFLALVAHDDLELHQMDVKTALLNGELNEYIYREQSEGCRDAQHPTDVCKLQKALYGLQQAPCQRLAKIDSFLCNVFGLKRCPYDLCFHVKRTSEEFLLLLLYVDDVLIAGNSLESIEKFKRSLHENFEVED